MFTETYCCVVCKFALVCVHRRPQLHDIYMGLGVQVSQPMQRSICLCFQEAPSLPQVPYNHSRSFLTLFPGHLDPPPLPPPTPSKGLTVLSDGTCREASVIVPAAGCRQTLNAKQ